MDQIVNALKVGYKSNKLKSIHQRIEVLDKLMTVLIQNEEKIYEALKKDFNKHPFESYLTELFVVYEEINFFKKNLKKLIKKKKIGTSLVLHPAKSYIMYEPKGVVLVIGAWNYPINLTLIPVIGAIASGNTVLLKPSEIASNSSNVLTQIINETFSENVIKCVEGGADVTTQILNEKFDHIFYTGSERVGKIIYEAAAKQLTPVTLELGGKSPAIIDKEVNLKTACKRLLWGKFVNGGQTCVAPDYLLVHISLKQDFIKVVNSVLEEFFKENKICNIINERNFERLSTFLDGNYKLIYGGSFSKENLYIEPTLIELNDLNHPIMKEEIFGPILPIHFYNDETEIKTFYDNSPNPLALYVFSSNKRFVKEILEMYPSGGACVNQTLMHVASNKLPFGGVGSSGIGSYHGEYSIKCFSHEKAVFNQSTWFDNFLLFQPYTDRKINLLKRLTKFFY